MINRVHYICQTVLRNTNIRLYSSFSRRHLGVNNLEIDQMLKKCNVNSLNNLIKEVIPNRVNHTLQYIPSMTEDKALKNINQIMDQNIITKNYIGLGYTQSILPNIIKRSILENPRWYTAYTPYQSEISQGRLESLHNYQKLVTDLTDLDISNASLLDEGSSSSEVINMFLNKTRFKKNDFFCSEDIHPYILDVIKTKAEVSGINLHVENLNRISVNDNTLGVLFQYPNTFGEIDIPFKLLDECKNKNVLTACNTNLLALTNIITPGELGIDIAFGNAGNLGVPLWFGGPHPAFISCSKDLIRHLPGRIIGESKDKIGDNAYRIALQTREQHIKRDKATSNICTSQALLANVVSMYSIYHGKYGLKNISDRISGNANRFHNFLNSINIKIINNNYFDTIVIEDYNVETLYQKLSENNILTRKIDNNKLGFTFDETTNNDDINKLIDIFTDVYNVTSNNIKPYDYELKKEFTRNTDFMNDSVFNEYQTETELLRYITKLDNKDYTLCDGLIPLGSCTMKLNSSTQLQPLSWENVMNIHPYAPSEYTIGYSEIINKLSIYLKDITGFEHVSYQSNSGAMGEYSGLLCIKKYHEDKNENRNICFIPESAHGTNFASAKLAGMKIIKFDDSISLEEFKNLVEKHNNNLACIMITYPGTDGVFQKNIVEINTIIHDNGGLVYMDGANMNALVGITSPAGCGADVCHLNLHKTFCIPHGGGGPGMGPILCNDKLGKYLPQNNLQLESNSNNIGNITSSQWSSASILTIPLIYIMTMGSENLRLASELAILNANYLKSSLEDYYTIKDVNENNRVGHEFIIDTTEFKELNISELDIAKRLIDYNFHPGTMSWPRKGVIMIEPTESESKKELDRFINAMISIRNEIRELEIDKFCLDNNVIKNSPHALNLLRSKWEYPYSINKAYYPVSNLENKKFPSVNRVDDAHGDLKLLRS
jgi:glycine dehydrogenase